MMSVFQVLFLPLYLLGEGVSISQSGFVPALKVIGGRGDPEEHDEEDDESEPIVAVVVTAADVVVCVIVEGRRPGSPHFTGVSLPRV